MDPPLRVDCPLFSYLGGVPREVGVRPRHLAAETAAAAGRALCAGWREQQQQEGNQEEEWAAE